MASGRDRERAGSRLNGDRTLVEIATEALRGEILCGHVEPGARIHLVETSQRLRMSPGPVREALRTLATEGLVRSLPQRGYRAAGISYDEFADIYRWRRELEPKAAGAAVRRLSDEQLADMREALHRLSRALRAEDWDEYQLHLRRFHTIPFEACGSPWLQHAVATLWDASVRFERLVNHRRGTAGERIAEDQAILDAFADRDRKAAGERVRRRIDRTVELIDELGPDALE